MNLCASKSAQQSRRDQRGYALSTLAVPKLDGIIKASTRYQLSIRTESNMIDLFLMPSHAGYRFLWVRDFGIRVDRMPKEERMVV